MKTSTINPQLLSFCVVMNIINGIVGGGSMLVCSATPGMSPEEQTL